MTPRFTWRRRRSIHRARRLVVRTLARRRSFARTTFVAVVGFLTGAVLQLLVGGCSHTLDYDRAHQLGCLEACARFAAESGRTATTGWWTAGNECACRFDDQTIDVTCLRPSSEGACP